MENTRRFKATLNCNLIVVIASSSVQILLDSGLLVDAGGGPVSCQEPFALVLLPPDKLGSRNRDATDKGIL